MSNTVNVVVLIPGQDTNSSAITMNSKHKKESDTLNLYTWFPYKSGRCGEVQDAVLQDEWVLEHNGRFSKNVYLFPEKVPKNLMGCPIRVSTLGIDPYVILTGNYTQNDGSVVYKLRGLFLQILHLVCEKITLMIFLPTSVSMKWTQFLNRQQTYRMFSLA
jgi:hypothetical protein